MAVVLAATVLPPLATPGVASAGGPSVELPPTKSVPVGRQATTARPPDPASANALSGEQQRRADKEGAGSHKATSLSPSATWDVSEQTGDFTWSYPLRVPPAPGGLAPKLALSYRSSAVDGHTSATNNQPSWVGDGWDLSPGFVERAYGGCADDTEGGTTAPKTGDLCWRSDNATAAFDGGGGMLILDNATKQWRTKSDNGARIERIADPRHLNGDNDGEHWKITTVDGTQYFFGSQVDSSSTWTVPVFGDDAAEPCHRPGSFDTSHCVQAWRWNLDKVVDPNGNMIRYFYDTETNKYGMNLKDAAVPYVRGGTLKRVEYGLNTRVDGQATGRVEFATADRCVPGAVCALDRPANWPDTPLDQRCDTNTCPKLYSPSFWSTKRLASVTTQVRTGSSYSDVDRWSLDQLFPDPGDGEKPALWLKGITHTGLVGGSIWLPAVTFEGAQLPNRVYQIGDGLAPLIRYRITGVVSESGGWTSVNYARPECQVDQAHPESNTSRCFPVRWAKKDYAERTDYFHKYVIDKVIQSDQLSTSTQQVTSYEYLGGAAWHWDMSEFVKDDKKTWNEYRGFGRVRTRVGAVPDPAGPVTMAEQRFYRGMDGDRLPNGTRSVTVSDTEGGVRTDHDWLNGVSVETAAFEREAASTQPDPPRVSKTIVDPVWQGPTATRGVYKAYVVRPGTQRVYTALRSGGWRTTKAETTFDALGLPTTSNDLGDVTTPADDRCTRTHYARGNGLAAVNLPSHVEAVAVDCATTPRFPDHALSDARMFYDGYGNLTGAEVARDRPASGPAYVATGTARHDVHGRITETTDPAGNTTRTGFTPATGGPVTQTTTTSPPTAAAPGGMVTTTVVEPAFGQAVKVTDPNGRVTETVYDALGRKVEVWLPNRPRASQPQGNFRFSYRVRRDAPTVVTSTQIGPNGIFTSSTTLFDGLLRPRQVQAPAVGGGRLLTDTRYDSHGRAFTSTQPYFNDANVDDQLWVAADAEVPGLTRTEFDGAGRAVASVYQAGAGTPQDKGWRTTTQYDGDRVHVTPPTGGTATTAITDARGQATEFRQYHGPAPTGSYDATRYSYTRTGQLAEVVSPGGSTWRFGYDLRGRKIRSEDPDSGVITSTYDDLDRLTSTRDALGAVLAYAYDSLSRRTALHRDSLSGPKLAEWVYDTARSGKGQLASSTRFVDGRAYTSSVYSYTALYAPTEQSLTIPATEGPLAGTYTWYGSYGWDGSLSGESYPAVGGLDREAVNYVHDDWGRPLTTSGGYLGKTVELVSDTRYTRYGEVERIRLGTGTKRSWLSYYYDTNTRRLNRSIVDAEVPAPMQSDVHYTYDDAGTITSIADKAMGQAADTQCFRHDHLRRLTEAWTPDGDCATDPSTNGLAGPAPYWHSYRYDKDGNRLSETRHAPAGDTERSYTYPAPGQAHPHAVQSISTRTPGGSSGTDTFTYDDVGNTTGRTKAGVGETLGWDAEGHLASVAKAGQTTSFLYTPDGARLLRKDPAGTTLYLGNQEVRLAASGGNPVATRYYAHGGKAIAMRQGAALTWLAGDHQATAQLAINSDSLQVTRRRQLPFGGPRGQAPVSWPDERGFLGGTQDPSTGLTHLGAREYDPETGRFISVDPILDVADPQQWNAYGYANNSPITLSDPDGLKPGNWDEWAPPPSTGSSEPPPPSSGGGNPGVTIVGVGAEGKAKAGREAHNIQVQKQRDGFRTKITYQDILVAVPNDQIGPVGLPGSTYGYNLVPGVIIGLTFTPVPQCERPTDSRTPVINATPRTTGEQAIYDAAHPIPPPQPAPLSLRDGLRKFLGDVTGVNAIVGAIETPSAGHILAAGLPFAAGPIGRVLGRVFGLGGRGTINPNSVRFSQETAKYRFSNGKDVDDLAEGLRNGSINPNSVEPIRLVKHEGRLFTLDNRRLVAFQTAGVNVPYRMATKAERTTVWPTRYDTTNGGTSIQLAFLGKDGRP